MPNTPTYAFPYPATTDAPTVPVHMQNLAVGIENKIKLMDNAQTAPIGGEFAASALQALTTGLNKLTLGATIIAASGITWNGTNQLTVLTSGLYAMTASVYMPGTANMNCFVGTSAASLNANVLVHGVFDTGGLSASCGGVRYLTAGTTISAYCYLNSANANTSFSTEPATLNVWKVASF